jgi:carboxyl-terminal processing protease
MFRRADHVGWYHSNFILSFFLSIALLIVQSVMVPSVEAQVVDGPDRLAIFDEALKIVEEQFYDPDMKGLNWAGLVAEYRERLAPGTDREAFTALVNELLAHLQASHTQLITRDQPQWYQVAGVFVDGYEPLRIALQPFMQDGAPVYTGIGVMLESRGDDRFVTGVLPGFPASAAGVLVGDRIVSVEGEAFHPIHSFAGKADRELSIVVERRPGEMRELTVTPEQIDGRTMFERAMRESASLFDKGDVRVGYIRAWSYAGQRYQDILVGELTNGSLRDADALVLDVRGGWGGASPSYLNFFVDRSIDAYSVMRDGEVMSFSSGWSRPVVLLVDGGSRSGKELLAYAFRALGKGPIVGETTAGAVLAGRINALSDGSLLYVAVADAVVAGERLEGSGVAPDIVVTFDPAYAAGADPQLERSIEVAAELAAKHTP